MFDAAPKPICRKMADTPKRTLNPTLDLTRTFRSVFSINDFAGSPGGSHGVLATINLKLPEARVISHFAAYQRHDPPRQPRSDHSIGGGSNRVQGLRITQWHQAIEGGVFAVMELQDGDWLALLPIAGPQSLAWLAPVRENGKRPSNESLQIKIGTLGTEPVEGELPVLAWSRSHSVYHACSDVWRMALKHSVMRGSGRLREEKSYPEMFRYLGWCSWEQYKWDIPSKVLEETARQINACGLPIRFFLVDDGYHCHTQTGQFKKDQLVRLGPNPELFPKGWQPLMSFRRDDGLRWFGLWQNHNGYWACVARDNELGPEIDAHLCELPHGGRLPIPSICSTAVFYEALLGVAREGGFDFVKVDDQAEILQHYRGTANAARAARLCSQAMERAATGQLDGLLNCMAQGPVNAFNTLHSAVSRCSEDYVVNNAWRAKAHLHNSYQNMLWLGPTVWGDHDMFHSSDTFAGRMMAVSKAVSGGPVYLSDAPLDFNEDIVRPLCDEDGLLYRPLAPAAPLPRCVTLNPFEQAEAYIAAAPLPNGAVALVAYNLTEPEQPVSGCIRSNDYQDVISRPDNEDSGPHADGEGIVLFDWYAGQAWPLSDSREFELNSFSDRLFLLCPIIHGWAVIGRTDKYLSPAAVTVRYRSSDCLVLETTEPCTVAVWHSGEVLRKELPIGRSIWNAP